jgi:hypothetical protein
MKAAGSSAWTSLGLGKRITGGWELNGQNFPATGCTIRGRGRAGGSLVEAVTTLPSAVESWRKVHFDTFANTGDAADAADPDHDGLTNLAEFAFGLSPVGGENSILPEFKHTGTAMTVSFVAPHDLDEVLEYRVESSPALLPGTWTTVPDSGSGSVHRFSVEAPGTGCFFVLRLSFAERNLALYRADKSRKRPVLP